MRHGKPLKGLFLLVGSGLSVPALAQDDVLHPRSVATGDAVAAHPEDIGAIGVNPATIALSERYDGEAHFELGPWPDFAFAVSAIDSRSTVVSLGLAWRRRYGHPEPLVEELPGWITTGDSLPKKRRTDDVALAIALPLLEHRLSFGINGSLSIEKDALTGNGVYGDLDVGVAGRPVKRWSVTFAAKDLIPLKSLRDAPPSLLLGNHFGDDWGGFALDVAYQTQAQGAFPLSFRTGAELTPGPHVGLLAGFRYEGPTEYKAGGLGFAWTEKKATFQYALEIPMNGTLRFVDLRHFLGFRIRG